MKRILRFIIIWIRRQVLGVDISPLEMALKNGMKLGKDCHIMGECILDPGHCWLIEIGDRVTIAPRVHILAHDASTKRKLDYTLIGKVKIGNDVFIGAGTIILPNVTIGNNVIVGSGSVITKSVPEGVVVAGNPARIIGDYDKYHLKRKNQFEKSPSYDYDYTISQITEDKRKEMQEALDDSVGFVR